MCDFVPGQIVLCYPSGDPAGERLIAMIKNENISHVAYVESILDRINAAGAFPAKELEYSLHLVSVPPGEEEWKITYLQFFYKQAFLDYLGSPGTDAAAYLQRFASRSDYQFTAEVNHVFSVASIGARIGRLFGRSGTTPGTVDATQFSFSADHITYKSLLGLTAPSRVSTAVRIGVLDTGIGDNFAGRVVGEHDFTSQKKSVPARAADDHGHGTMVSMIVEDVCSGCEFLVLKVADSSGTAAEWDMLAALCVDHRCHVLNLSLAFGLQDVTCANCGRQSHSSRSAVFENVFNSVSQLGHSPVIVAAAGNQSLPNLEYPARFGNVLAVGSIDSARKLSSFSNVGNTTHDGLPHTGHCVAPGGQTRGVEMVGSSPHDKYFGTSFAAAYATGIVALDVAGGTQTNAVLHRLRSRASTTLPNFSSTNHGFGLLQV